MKYFLLTNQQLGIVDFELDPKTVVDSFYGDK